MKRLILLGFICAIGGISLSRAQGRKPPQPGPAPVASPPAQPDETAPPQGFRKVTLEEAKRLFDGHEAVFVDGRAPASYAVRHIQGAFNCSLSEFEPQSEELKARVGLDRLLVVYCGGESCSLAEKVSERLSAKGLKKIVIFAAGWPAWAQAQYPMEP